MVGASVPLAVLPAGTANVLANEIGIGSRMSQAARRIPDYVPRRVPLGKLECEDVSQHFVLMAGAGLDAHIVLQLDSALKARLGKGAYWIAGAREFLRKLEVFDAAIDGKAHSCSFALISKVRNYGGDFEIAREVTLLDDQFEVVLFEGSNPLRYVPYLAAVAAGKLDGLPGVHIYRAREVELRPRNGDQVHLQVDGEYAGRLPARVTMLHEALTLLAPRAYPPA